MIRRIFSMLPAIPHSLLLKAALIGLVFASGFLSGNNHATERALLRELDQSSQRQAKNHSELIAWYAERMKELRLAREQQHKADTKALATLQRGKANVDIAITNARAEIAKLRKDNEALASAGSDPGCVMAPELRDILDTAIERVDLSSTNRGSDAAHPPPVPVRPYTTAPILTCGQLQRGFLNLLTAYGNLKADVEAEVQRQSGIGGAR